MLEPGVELLPAIRCKCGNPISQYYEKFTKHLNEGKDPNVFFKENRIKNLCCMMELQSPAVISRGKEYYNIELIEGRVSLNQARLAATSREILGGFAETGGIEPVYKEKMYPKLAPGASEPGQMIGGGYVGAAPPEVKRGTVISGMYTEPVMFTGKYRIIPTPHGEPLEVPIVRCGYLTQPVKSTYDSRELKEGSAPKVTIVTSGMSREQAEVTRAAMLAEQKLYNEERALRRELNEIEKEIRKLERERKASSVASLPSSSEGMEGIQTTAPSARELELMNRADVINGELQRLKNELGELQRRK